MKKYYKVVSKELKSARASRNFDSLSINYKIGKWVEPHLKGSNLMVFSTLLDAKTFADIYIGDRIFECEVLKPSRSGIIFDTVTSINMLMKRIITLKRMKKKYKHLVNGNPPKGTIFCSAVKLIQEIKYS